MAVNTVLDEAVRTSLYEPRIQFIPFHERSKRWAHLTCHRRAGKTVAVINELIERGLYTPREHSRYGYVAPYYAQAKAVAWDYLLRYSTPFRTRANIAELSVDLFNGSRVRLFGGDNPDALRGLYFDGVGMDEPAQMKPRLYPEVIRPALSDRRGWAVFMGTPAGKNEFWEIRERALKSPEEWFVMTLKASQSGILPQSELDAAAADMDDDEYDQEYECSFDAAIRGSFYGKTINKMGARLGHYPYLPGFRVHTCWDLGYTDDTVIWFFQIINRVPMFFDVIADSGLEIADYVELLRRKRERYDCTFGEHYLPHDARAHSLQTSKSIQDRLLAHEIRGRIVPDMSVQDGINATRYLLSHCCIDENACYTAVEALRQYQREWDEDKKTFKQKPRHDWTSHYADALRVGALGWREDYGPPALFVPEKYRPKPPMHEGIQLNELWKTVPTHRSTRI